MLIKKVLRFLSAPDKKVRLISLVNKSPLRFLIKRTLQIFAGQALSRRTALLENLKLSERETATVSQLNEFGYAVVTDLIDPELLRELGRVCEEKHRDAGNLASAQALTHKDFWVRLSDQEAENTDNVFVKFALQEKILKVVSRYFGKAAFFEYFLLTLSKGTDSPLKSSQLWHLDYDNVGMLKMFAYLTDVEDDLHGPFTFIDKKSSLKVTTHLWNSHIEDQKLYQFVGPKSLILMKHKRLSVFMVDTSKCYHMGSRLKQGYERLMYTALYLDLPSVYPWSGRKKITDTTGTLSALQDAAITP